MPEILTPDEIAALTDAFAADAPAAEPEPTGPVRTIDLASQERSLEGRLPGLDLVLARFGRGLRNVLAGCFGDLPNVRTASVGLVRFGRLAPLLVEPTALVRFRLTPLRGQAILTIPPPLLAAMLQAACGGPAGSAPALPVREFSPVELALIERFASRVLAALRAAWQPIVDLGGGPVQVDTTPLLAAVAAPEELVVHAELTIAGAGIAPSTLGLVVPNGALDPVRTRLESVRTADDGTAASSDAPWVEALRARLLEVPIDVAVELGTARLTLSRLVALAAGDLLTLDVGRDGPAVVRIAGTPRFLGVPGVQNGNNAVRITERA